MRIKICGLTRTDQAVAIAAMGASALGFICVRQSPRYVSPDIIRTIVQALPPIDRIGVFANASLEHIQQTTAIGQLSGIQLHGQESPTHCQQLRHILPDVELIKVLRIRTPQDLVPVQDYAPYVDTFLLDAYHPQQLGGTGNALDWETLREFNPKRPWFLAGGLGPHNVARALSLLSPDGIDLSSSVETSPGNKDISKVAQLFEAISLTSEQQKIVHL
ncbi:MAG: phosphoribosylanthranilate isomerase [Symploca sp. SIO2G7]|nr:phosphoribosylanthranilate isomerase [Symploca sp. SIO2G7]